MRTYPLNVGVPLSPEASGSGIRPRSEHPNQNVLGVGDKITDYSGPGYFGDPDRLPRVKLPLGAARGAGSIVNTVKS